MTSGVVTLIKVVLDVDRWAVTAPADAWDETDLPVARDPRSGRGGDGAIHLPATSLAGALRAHLSAAQAPGAPDVGADPPQNLAEVWLGQPPPEEAELVTGTLTYRPGRLWCLGVEVAPTHAVTRGRTAIDEDRGAAAAGAFRSETFVPRGALTLLLQHDGARDETLVDLLTAWRPYVGRGRSGGMGAAAVTLVETLTVDLSVDEHLTWWLTGRHDWPGATDAPVDAVPATPKGDRAAVDPRYRWVVKEPIHVGVDDDTGPGQALPTLRSDGVAVVPGESWKGVFRHRTRMILRSCGADDDLVAATTCVLFGDAEHGRGVLRFHDTYAGAASHVQTHVAIDRFTGGALDGGLFALESIPRGTQLDLAVEADPELDEALWTLLDHVAVDLHDGLVGIGGGGGRGYGWVTFQQGHDRTAGPVDLAAVRASMSATPHPVASASHSEGVPAEMER